MASINAPGDRPTRIRNDSGGIHWWEDAACVARPDLPWGTDGAGVGNHPNCRATREAISVCKACPVLPQCAEEARRTETEEADVHGIRAGRTAPERRAALTGDKPCPDCDRSFSSASALASHRSRAHGWRPECGTVGGYQRHKRDGTEVCTPCREAWNEDRRVAS